MNGGELALLGRTAMHLQPSQVAHRVRLHVRWHAVAVRWHLAPGAAVQLQARGAVVTTAAGDFMVSVSAWARLRLGVQPGMVATGFQSTTVAPVLTCRIDSGLPVRVSTCWRRASRGRTE